MAKADNNQIELPSHIVQSQEWGEVKTLLGTKSVMMKGGVRFTLHKIPILNKNFGFCPKVNPEKIDWQEAGKIGKDNNCVCIRFDVPNSIKGKYTSTFSKHCQKSPKSTFAKKTVFLDITKSEEDILKNMHPKTRYNIKLAAKKGVVVKEGDEKDLDIFLRLQRETADRQKFYIHKDSYYKTIYSQLLKAHLVHSLIACKDNTPLTAWLLFVYEKVIYYVYGGSSNEHKDLMPSNLIAWETIKLGKRLGCNYFDMWGIADNPDNEKDPWYGFTKFKLGFGGEIIEFEDSWDLVINPVFYRLFNFLDIVRWFVLKRR